MSTEETVKIKLNMSLHYAINTSYDEEVDTGITRADWDQMDADERNRIGGQMYEEFVWEQVDGGWEIAK